VNRILRLLIVLVLVITSPAGEAPAPPLTAPGVVAPGATVTTAPTPTVGGNDATLPTAGPAQFNAGGLVISVDQPQGTGGWSTAVSILLLITVLAVAPSFLMMVTCFTRIVIVLGFLRRALGTQTLPPNQVMVGLALFLTLFVMAPVIGTINTEAVQPYMAGTIETTEALTRGAGPLKQFMLSQTRESDIATFVRISGGAGFDTPDDVPLSILVPAFATSELKTAFQIGFLLFIPFVIIDLVVASVLMSMGMMMLSPVLISLPFKIMLFVLVDGWSLVMGTLAASFSQ
jgi:flagellar biosynthetic protein FliP